MAEIRVNVSSVGSKGTARATNNAAQYWAEKAREWAISENPVSMEDNSSKYYAGKAKEYAQSAQQYKNDAQEIADTAETNINSLTSKFNSLYSEKSEALQSEYSNYSSSLEAAKTSAITSIQTTGTEANTSITTASTTALSDIATAKNTAVEDIQDEAETQISNIQSTGFYMRDGKLYYTDREGQEQEFKSGGDGLPLLSIRHALYVNEALGLDYYLNGQLLTINKNLQGAAAALISLQTTTPSLFTTEQSWQAEKEASDYGQVGKFVLNYDDVADKYHAVGYDRYIFEVSLHKTTDTINSYRTAFCIHKLKDNIEVGDIGYLFDTATGEENQNITFTVTQVEANAGTEYAFFRLGGTVSGYPDYNPPGSGIESALDGTDIAANNNNSPVLQILKGPTYTKSRSGEGKNFCIPDTTIGAVCYEVPYPSSPNSFTAIPHLLTHFEFVDGGILGDSSYSIGIDNEEILTDYGLYPTQPVYHYTPSTKVLISMRLPAVVNVQGVLNLQNAGLTIKAELPNIIGTFRGGNTISGTALTGAFYNAGSAGDSKSYNASAGREYYELYAGFNASLSSPKYKDGATVQEEAIQYPYVIRLATGQETEVNIRNDIESIVPYTLFDSKYSEAKQYNASWVLRGSTLSKSVYPTAYEAALVEYNSEIADGTTVELPSGGSYTKRGVSGGITVKLSTDETVTEYDWKLDTVAETLTVPTLNGSEDLLSDRYDDLELKASGSTYTAPANGWFWIQKLSSSTGQYLTPVIKDSNGNIKYTLTSQPTAAGYDAEILAPVSKGDVISTGYNVGGATKSFRFIYAKSNGSLYFFVASVAQNAPLANLGRIEETKVDKNSSWGFPSNRYIDLTLGASGSTYTAPANGWICVEKQANAANQYISGGEPKPGQNGSAYSERISYITSYSSLTSLAPTIFFPVRKGSTYFINYTAGGDTLIFRFIYANGSQGGS